MLMEFFFLFHS